MLKNFAGRRDYVILHTEGAGSYFNENSTEFIEYCALINFTSDYIRSEFPTTKVSVYNTNYESEAISACLNKNTDWWASELVINSTFPAALADIKIGLENDKRRAKSKPIGIVEVNYPSSPRLSQNPSVDQAKFVDAFFDYLQKDQTKYLFANWYGINDETYASCAAWVNSVFGNYGQDFVTQLILQFTNQGLRTSTNVAKSAWNRWLAALMSGRLGHFYSIVQVLLRRQLLA